MPKEDIRRLMEDSKATLEKERDDQAESVRKSLASFRKKTISKI